MSELLLKSRSHSWLIDQGGGAYVGEILLDPWDQVERVLVSSTASEVHKLEVLRLAATHVRRYVRFRTTTAFGCLMKAGHRNPALTREDSDRIMLAADVPNDIKAMSHITLTTKLLELNVDVVVVVHRHEQEAIQEAINETGMPISYEISRTRFDGLVQVRFKVDMPHVFTFWKGLSKPGQAFDLDIVPAYHPMMNGKSSGGMVNGDTDAFLGNHAIEAIHCPVAAVAGDTSKTLGVTWTHVNHPYYAKGPVFIADISTTKIRSLDGMRKLTEVLRAALELDNQFIEISGGFRAPMRCPHNRLDEIKQSSPRTREPHDGRSSEPRGSEAHCVWSYRVLRMELEGALEKAYIPSWFHREGWLKIYEGATVKHGLY